MTAKRIKKALSASLMLNPTVFSFLAKLASLRSKIDGSLR